MKIFLKSFSCVNNLSNRFTKSFSQAFIFVKPLTYFHFVCISNTRSIQYLFSMLVLNLPIPVQCYVRFLVTRFPIHLYLIADSYCVTCRAKEVSYACESFERVIRLFLKYFRFFLQKSVGSTTAQKRSDVYRFVVLMQI